MTEQEWLECTDSERMLEFFRDKGSSWASVRKLRLLACACCRHGWNLLTEPLSRRAVEAAERYADGQLSEVKRRRAFQSALAAQEKVFKRAADLKAETWDTDETDAANAAVTAVLTNDQLRLHGGLAHWDNVVYLGRYRAENKLWEPISLKEDLAPMFLRDIFGPLPFRFVTVDPRWLTSTVVDLAQAIYQERAFDRMPILADALTDAGCDNEEIIAHCRGDGPHVRGCWVVDLVLGKE